MTAWSLEEALTEGRGEERPFRCHVHEDSNASASVNVTKGVWYCFACFASGTIDGKKVPSIESLEALAAPESPARIYPESYLQLFSAKDSYWHTRFPDWLVYTAQLGNDPFTGHATFPVRSDTGRLNGVGRRDPDPEAKPRYRYPSNWSAARSLHGLYETTPAPQIVLVEGAADAVSLWECGIPALACYGAGLHKPQVEYLLRRGPSEVLLGFDMDAAGDRAAEMTARLLAPSGRVVERIQWPLKDPAECTPAQRKTAVVAVGGEEYVHQWSRAVADHQAAYQRSVD